MEEWMGKSEAPRIRARGWWAGIARAALPAVAGALLSGPVSAAVVFGQLPVSGNDSFASISVEQGADDFRMSATTEVSGVTWWDSYTQHPGTLPADEFRVQIFADDGSGRPAINPMAAFSQQATRTEEALLVDVTGARVYRFDLAVAPLTLAGGNRWYLSVVNQFDVNNANAGWFWLLSDTSGENFYRFASVDAWTSDLAGNFAFQLTGNAGAPVSLPGSAVLLLSGLAAMNALGMRRQRNLASRLNEV